MKQIMIVDDNPDIRKTVKKALEFFNPNCKVICVENGNKCFEMLKDNKIPDLIILDVKMPGMSGWMLIDRLQENPKWKDILVVILTGRLDHFAEEFGKSVSVDFIRKPFDLIDFKTRINKFFDMKISYWP